MWSQTLGSYFIHSILYSIIYYYLQLIVTNCELLLFGHMYCTYLHIGQIVLIIN